MREVLDYTRFYATRRIVRNLFWRDLATRRLRKCRFSHTPAVVNDLRDACGCYLFGFFKVFYSEVVFLKEVVEIRTILPGNFRGLANVAFTDRQKMDEVALLIFVPRLLEGSEGIMG